EPREAGFWAAVERGDIEELSAMLAVDGDPRASLGDLLPGLASWHRRRRNRSTVDGWLYRPSWVPVTGGHNRVPPGRWLAVLPAADAWVTAVLDGLASLGMRIDRLVVLGIEDPTAIADRIGDALAAPTAGVLSLLAVDETPCPEHPLIPRGLAATTALAQAMAA